MPTSREIDPSFLTGTIIGLAATAFAFINMFYRAQEIQTEKIGKSTINTLEIMLGEVQKCTIIIDPVEGIPIPKMDGIIIVDENETPDYPQDNKYLRVDRKTAAKLIPNMTKYSRFCVPNSPSK